MLTISIIFTLLVALWGHPRVIEIAQIARKRRDDPRRAGARDRTHAGPPASTADDH